MEGNKAYILPVVAALVLLAYYAWSSMTPDEPEPEPEAPAAKAPAKKAAARSEADEPEVPDERVVARRETSTRPSPARSGSVVDRGQKARRDAVRERIEQAQRERMKRAEAEDEEDEDEGLGTLSAEYIQQTIKDELVPLATECYEMALEDDDGVEGRLALRFRIVGEPEVGGIVEEAELTPNSDITHPELVECMRESMMSVSFEPPQGGGAVEVTYPFLFAQAEP